MISFCRWGMHLPGASKVFHRGHLFTRCTECDATLIAGAGGWAPVPPGRRVTWRARRPDDRIFAFTNNSQRERLRFSLLAALRRPRPPGEPRIDSYAGRPLAAATD